MFGIDKLGADVTWTIGLGRIDSITCKGKNDLAKESAEKLISDYHSCQNLIYFLDKVFNNETHEYTLKEINDKANYIAHFITHRIYLLLSNIEYIIDNYSALNKVFGELNFDSQRFGSKLRSIISEINNSRNGFLKNEIMSNDIFILSNNRCDLGKDLVSRIKSYVKHINAFHYHIACLSRELCDTCKAESVQEKPELLKVVYDLYCKMECFLKEEDKLDKAECDEIKKLTVGVETDILVQDAAQAMYKLAKLDKSTISQSDKDVLKRNCYGVLKSLGIGEVKKTAVSDVNLPYILKELSDLRKKVDKLESQKESSAETRSEIRDPKFSSNWGFGSEINDDDVVVDMSIDCNIDKTV